MHTNWVLGCSVQAPPTPSKAHRMHPAARRDRYLCCCLRGGIRGHRPMRLGWDDNGYSLLGQPPQIGAIQAFFLKDDFVQARSAG
jgi:hypothetical protein